MFPRIARTASLAVVAVLVVSSAIGIAARVSGPDHGLLARVAPGAMPIAAIAGCSGSSCVGLDPQSQGCSSGARGLATASPPGGGPDVILRWSSACVANWARWDDNQDGGFSPGSWTWWVETKDSQKEFPTFGNSEWTFMVNGNMQARACIKGVATSQFGCTGWF
jgi:hypothetical protein